MIDSKNPLDEEYAEILEAKRKRNEHWLRMRRAKAYWEMLYGPDDISKFWPWLDREFGLKPEQDSYGNIIEGYVITDEKKYTIFLLKFSQ